MEGKEWQRVRWRGNLNSWLKCDGPFDTSCVTSTDVSVFFVRSSSRTDEMKKYPRSKPVRILICFM